MSDEQCFLNEGHVNECKGIETVFEEFIMIIQKFPIQYIKRKWSDPKYLGQRVTEYRMSHARCSGVVNDF